MWFLKPDLAIHSLCEILVIFIPFSIGVENCDFSLKGWQKEVLDNKNEIQNNVLKGQGSF